MGTSAPGDLDCDQIIVLPPEAGYGKVCGGGVPDHRRLALISVRLPDREIGSTDFNDGLAMTNEGADGVLGADQLKAALAPICAKKFQRSHDSSRTPRESPPAVRTVAACAWHYAAQARATAVARGRHQPVNLVQAEAQSPSASRHDRDSHPRRSLRPPAASRIGRSRPVPRARGGGDQRNDFAMIQIVTVLMLMVVLAFYLRWIVR